MPTWTELKEYARARYALDDDSEDEFSLIFEFATTGRTQKIGITRFTAFERNWIEFRSYVCKGAQLDRETALRKNEDFAIGALALDEEGDYCLVYSVALDGLDPDLFEIPLHALAHIADELEAHYAKSDDF
ncbi:MAG TPA: hypothetical protein VGC41_15090 [Kofleriaceae bacterium]